MNQIVRLAPIREMRVKRESKTLRMNTGWDKKEWLSRSDHKDTSTATFESPLCDILIGACESGIHSISWQMNNDSSMVPKARQETWGAVTGRQGPSCAPLEEAVAWLRQYFRDPHVAQRPPPLCLRQVKVESCIPIWHKLKDQVGPGTTISYGGLAQLCGNPKASRHVGYAMGHNPFTLVVPCHRVVTSSGKLGNYCRGRGNQLKTWLHAHELGGLDCESN
ncbi:methylated-DNA--protein-cysteine methyltransferase-like isoform X2 [Pollicipes pollicipes]|uniref:methylated-DNA--protein-cysteine methyltransferase-like isoform X2 n=1 Tax=Pollicipes pollicipes TaxID=41117 RepID=UPI0018856949|nr:methylated-DNA--protein-cysteine methyltransferase-like isoform X2 [Pollicipes pollicipes]